MKRLFLAALLTMALVPTGFSQPGSGYTNNGVVTNIPVIDAINFVNNDFFDIAFNSFSTGSITTLLVTTADQPFDFSDVQNYTNRGFMACDTGFIFDDAPSGNGARHASALFGNANIGQISAGSYTNIFTSDVVFFVGPNGLSASGTPSLTVNATNIINNGLMDVGINGFIGLSGQTLNIQRGTLHVETVDDVSSVNFGTNIIINGGVLTGTALDFGIFDDYWGIGYQTNVLSQANLGVPPLGSDFSPSTMVTNFPGIAGSTTVFPPLPETFFYTNQVDASNFTYQLVIVNTNIVANGVAVNVGFEPGGNGFQTPVIQWSSFPTNGSTQLVETNTLYLQDTFGSRTNFQVLTNGTSLTGLNFIVPVNYTVSRSFAGFNSLNPSNAVYDGTIFNGLPPITNEYSALGVSISPVTATPDPSSTVSSVSNVPGRIQLVATNSLDLTRATVTGANYLNLTSTNHFVGSAGADIVFPYADIYLGTTNGTLTVSNLVAPYVPFYNGTIDAYSARWTNITAAGVTNRYHVLIVDAELQPTTSVQLNNLSLRATNLYISDWLNVASNLLLNAQNVTISSNACGAATSTGQITVANGNITWSPSFPVLQNLTNWGSLSFPNEVVFEGIRQPPYYASNFTEPYQSLVNHGAITCSGTAILANYFENTGVGAGLVTNCNGSVTNSTNLATILSSFGPFTLQCTNAVMANGAIEEEFVGDISITSGALTISNQILYASGALTLTITNLLTDTGTNSSNIWGLNGGMNLPILPAQGDLLGTTITNTCANNIQVDNLWAGQDRGNSVNGFLNDGAVGQLILNGGNAQSTFYFSGPGATNAIYIDLIQLENGATNRSEQNVNGQNELVFTAIDVAQGMTVYFADAIANGQDISAKLNGTPTFSGGNIVWVPSYAGHFSSTNVTYPSGITYTLNRGLVASLSPSLPFEGEDIKLAMKFNNNPGSSAAVITWQTLANATNFLYTSTNLLSTNWTLVTNFSVNASGSVSVTNSAPAYGQQYYKVRVDPVQP